MFQKPNLSFIYFTAFYNSLVIAAEYYKDQ